MKAASDYRFIIERMARKDGMNPDMRRTRATPIVARVELKSCRQWCVESEVLVMMVRIGKLNHIRA